MLELNKDNFKKEVLDFTATVLVDFFAPWCGPCKMMLPVVEEISKEIEGSAAMKIAKVNVDENSELAEEYGIMSIPCFVLFKGGKEVERVMGAQAKAALLELLKK
ncbi:MAG: lpbca thioredoxin [Candidatus Magasanikbacteria bacterium GW2011_GWC2_40_17]|uniref:Thioredoxin n=1 Tax=Candidatus Magasanikbacteria bacterium GW2011_GWA2_42_32 TaxID=1619039 RepID=A0A0G1CE69_9BACT|nr:MAG: lpbca thioredoxin [Candidatus Magasanikbacteria bacterium GW2011_GWC2_40_17]KKS56986.1 MAG: lpbca thioredoxin [Candidatus Magasanikbacteria bacterium GW2011_GWA2_42_32]OGH85714.1 MAG: thioredoxin [Candidatus Magasanikbacteria bacterium RIFOXYB2_FULL_38_10]